MSELFVNPNIQGVNGRGGDGGVVFEGTRPELTLTARRKPNAFDALDTINPSDAQALHALRREVAVIKSRKEA